MKTFAIDPLELIDPAPYTMRPRRCPKCTAADLRPTYLAAHQATPAWNITYPEQLVWRCTTCSWGANTRCADTNESDPCGGGDLPEPCEWRP